MNSSPRQTVSAGNLLRSTLCPRADIFSNCLTLYQRLLRVRFCPRGPVMDTLHGSSAQLIRVDFNMAETVRLRGIEPLDSRSATPPTKPSAMVGVLRSFLIAILWDS
jgi:hypothetical protein